MLHNKFSRLKYQLLINCIVYPWNTRVCAHAAVCAMLVRGDDDDDDDHDDDAERACRLWIPRTVTEPSTTSTSGLRGACAPS